VVVVVGGSGTGVVVVVGSTGAALVVVVCGTIVVADAGTVTAPGTKMTARVVEAWVVEVWAVGA
jgi:hypothetical protein